MFYVVGYTMLLKRRTTQNIVWGGAAGCFPALIGWTAVTGELAWAPVVLFLVVFFWTPPHFWALAIRYREDYAGRRRADAAGRWPAPTTVAEQIVVYAYVMVATSLLLWPVAGTGWFYPVVAVVLGVAFLVEAHLLLRRAARHRRRRRAQADAAVPLVEHVPVAAVRRRRARPAAHPLSRSARGR